MSDLPPPGFPSPGEPSPPRPPQQPSSPLPPPGAPDVPGGQRGIGQPPSGGAPQFGAPQFGAPPPPPSSTMVPVQSGGPRRPWWKGPAGLIVALTAVVAIIVGVVLAVSGGDDSTTKPKTTDSVEVTDRDTRPPRTEATEATSPRRTTTEPDTEPDTTPDTGGSSPVFTLPDLTNPPTTVGASTTSPSTTSATSGPATGPATTTATTPGGMLAIGGAAAVTDGTDSVQVVVLDAVDDAPATEFLPPDAGDKLVAVKFRFVNTGTTVLGITPTFDTTLIDASKQQFDAGINPTTLGPVLSFARLVPGDVRVGWVTYSVPTASTAARIQWKLNFSENGAQWDLTLPRQDPPASPGVVAPAAAFNTPVTVTGAGDQPIAVTALKLVDNATPSFGTPGSDVRYVAVQVSFANTGQTAVSESPEFDVDLIDSDGQQYTSFIFGTDAGPPFDGQVDLAPGDSRTGFISYEIPAAAKAFKLQVSLTGATTTNVGEIAVG